MNKQFVISEELANKVLAYLITKPWGEVHLLIVELQRIKPIGENPDTTNNLTENQPQSL